MYDHLKKPPGWRKPPGFGHCGCCHGGELLCSSSVVHGGNNGCIGKAEARCRAGDGQTLPFWGSALWDLLKRLAVLACSHTALLTLAVPRASKLTKGERLQHKAKKALSCSASPGHGKPGRERRETPFPTTPGMAWANLALVSNVFPLTAPGTVNLSCSLPLSHKQVQHCNFCLYSVLFAGPYLHWSKQQISGAQS